MFLILINFNNAEFEMSVAEPEQLPDKKNPEIVISGRSNVGKSSFINRLICRKSLARISSKPGKTIYINFYKVDKIRLVDMPGYGYAKVSFLEKLRWSKLVEGYFNSNREIHLVVQLIDFRHSPSNQDMDMIRYLSIRGIPFVIVATKADKLNKGNRELRQSQIKTELSNYNGVKTVIFSSITGEGLNEIREIICEKRDNEIK